jgi:hypothetical protein
MKVRCLHTPAHKLEKYFVRFPDPDSATQQIAQWVKKAEEIESRYLLELD